jgi:hypothetical protein
MSSDESPTPQGLNVFGNRLMGRIFDPFGVGNSICGRPDPWVSPTANDVVPLRELFGANLNAPSYALGLTWHLERGTPVAGATGVELRDRIEISRIRKGTSYPLGYCEGSKYH